MRVFQRVVEEGGFAAAARKLGLDPAVVTRLVADLETHLGSRLLQRTTRRISLTPAGEEYLARLKPILADIDEADDSVRGQAQELRGRLRILALPVVCTHMIAPAFTTFRKRHPEISVELRSLDMAEPPLEDYDLTFIHSSAPLPADVVRREVAGSNALLFASPAYLKRHGTPRKPADLARHSILQLRLAGARTDRMHLLQPELQLEEVVEVAPALVSDLADPLLRATLEGVGISSQATDIAAPYVRNGFLQAILAPWITTRLTLVVAYPSRRYLPARARVFLDHFTDHMRRNVMQEARA
jgi:DNA-binding transcriptional LysR family regulator